ncbi:DUF5345 family protein [Paenibacillus sp. D2_2]|uniref:DUF5345 family protein n=1 Tax=Paenibacillus sp. D2_2 TaxID=3073092 RepID=UPI002816806E|nr:DUF5345 family protein [Paenibacillus sp. D2_2]WMT40334.1 DUF5345 family protein [Paenibacillus sp. D2_2]
MGHKHISDKDEDQLLTDLLEDLRKIDQVVSPSQNFTPETWMGIVHDKRRERRRWKQWETVLFVVVALMLSLGGGWFLYREPLLFVMLQVMTAVIGLGIIAWATPKLWKEGRE